MLLDTKLFLVKEHVAVLKIVDTYDIFDAETGKQIGLAKEEPPAWVQVLRFFVNKQLLPTKVSLYEEPGHKAIFSIHRPVSFLRSTVKVTDGSGNQIGYFKSKAFSLGGRFSVFDTSGRQVADIKGDWKGWNFKFLTTDGRELGQVTKKWAGIAKELFTSADNYVVSVHESLSSEPVAKILLLAAALAVDIVYKERR